MSDEQVGLCSKCTTDLLKRLEHRVKKLERKAKSAESLAKYWCKHALGYRRAFKILREAFREKK